MKYFDPEYGRIVPEATIRKQFEWFKLAGWTALTYESFRARNFRPVLSYLVYDSEGRFVYDTASFERARSDVEMLGGRVETADGRWLFSKGV